VELKGQRLLEADRAAAWAALNDTAMLKRCIPGCESIAAAGETWRDTDLAARLARHHADAARVFREWHDTWLSPAFRDWNIEEFVPPITAPILAIQGEDDEYATMEQIDRIARLGQNVACLKLADCGHSPQRDQPAAVIAAFAAFVSRLTGNT